MIPKVSVIMGIYNCENTLSVAINSIIKQTYTNWELIMCDDGSTDDTYKVAENYKNSFPDKIVLLKNESNLKLAATLNQCLQHASGEYIARMDADDENLPDRIEKEVKFLVEHPEIDCVGCGRIIFDESGDQGIRIENEFPQRSSLLHGAPFAHPTIMMRKSVYDELNGYTSSIDTVRSEDIDLWFRFFEKDFKGYVIQEPLYRYRESLNDFKKRTFKAAIGTSKTFLNGYRKLGFPIYMYIYVLKPIIAALIPDSFMKKYHDINDINL